MNFDLIVSDYYEAIYTFAYHLSRSREDAEDITQDTFLRAQRNLHQLKSPGLAKHWLYKIARNVFYDRKRSLKYFLGFIKSERDSPPSTSHEPELETILAQLIQRLPLRQREVFILRHWHEFSTEETARLLGISEGSVKSHLSRAILKLKDDLTDPRKTTKVDSDASIITKVQI